MQYTCKRCATQYNVEDYLTGRISVCRNCGNALDGMSPSPSDPLETSNFSAGCILIIVCVGIAFSGVKLLSDAKVSKTSKKTRASSVQPSTPQSYSSNKYRPPRPLPITLEPPPFTAPELPLPYHGQISRQTTDKAIAPFEIRSSTGSHYLVKLSDVHSGKDILAVFVHGGKSTKLDIPLGTYQVKYASGEKWYGPDHLFGPNTFYSKADKTFEFRIVGNQVSGYTITLYKVANGNLRTSKISADDF